MELLITTGKGKKQKVERYLVTQIAGDYRYRVEKRGEARDKGFDIVSPDRCSCESFTFRKKCKHLTWARRFGLVPGDPEAARPNTAALLTD